MNTSDHDKAIRNLFQGFNPELRSSAKFMDELNERCRAVDMLREICQKKQRENRLAVIIASITGFITGILMTLAFPYIKEMMSALIMRGMVAFPRLTRIPDIALDYPAWALTAVITVAVSLSTYSLVKANARS